MFYSTNTELQGVWEDQQGTLPSTWDSFTMGRWRCGRTEARVDAGRMGETGTRERQANPERKYSTPVCSTFMSYYIEFGLNSKTNRRLRPFLSVSKRISVE